MITADYEEPRRGRRMNRSQSVASYNPWVTRQVGYETCCGVWRFLAVFCDRFVSLVADDEDAGGGLDDVVRDGVQLVDLEDSVDLRE